MQCEGRRTLSGLLREVAEPASLAGLSRFLWEAPWSDKQLVECWLTRLRMEMAQLVEAERNRQRKLQPQRRGRPKQPLVTGSVIGDDEGVVQAQRQEDGRLGQAPLDLLHRGVLEPFLPDLHLRFQGLEQAQRRQMHS